ncbi:hypothetical protein M3Y99_01252000 [Aphelenchoides fujianensis]|nr:hypothetical protein M3Y99_01252000 [Aphelenchoides fujianensis]
MEYAVFCNRLKKADVMLHLLRHLQHEHCVVLCDSEDLTIDVWEFLETEEVPSELFCKGISKAERAQALQSFNSGRSRRLVVSLAAAADLKVAQADLVFNVRVPDANSRPVASGAANITLLGNSREAEAMWRSLRQTKAPMRVLEVEDNDAIPVDLVRNHGYYERCVLFMEHPIICGAAKGANGRPPQKTEQPTAAAEAGDSNAAERPDGSGVQDTTVAEEYRPQFAYSARKMIEILDSHSEDFYRDFLPKIPWLDGVDGSVLWRESPASARTLTRRYVRNPEAINHPGMFIATVLGLSRQQHKHDKEGMPIDEAGLGEIKLYQRFKKPFYLFSPELNGPSPPKQEARPNGHQSTPKSRQEAGGSQLEDVERDLVDLSIDLNQKPLPPQLPPRTTAEKPADFNSNREDLDGLSSLPPKQTESRSVHFADPAVVTLSSAHLPTHAHESAAATSADEPSSSDFHRLHVAKLAELSAQKPTERAAVNLAALFRQRRSADEHREQMAELDEWRAEILSNPWE